MRQKVCNRFQFPGHARCLGANTAPRVPVFSNPCMGTNFQSRAMKANVSGIAAPRYANLIT